MTEEKKEVEPSEEDEKESEEKEENKESEKSSEEEGTPEEEEKEDFEKEKEFVPVNKFNQTQRKLREAELEKRELEKKLAEFKPAKESAKEEEDKFFEDEDEDKEKNETPDVSALVDEKVKPVLDAIKKREETDRKKDRSLFFDAHPEYREDSEKWSGLLDTADKYINPSGDYYEQLNAAHILYTGQDMGDTEVADKKREMAGDAATFGTGAQKAGVKEEFTKEDRKIQKDFNISDEGMKAYKEKLKSGSMQILG